jgi:hypothetical protein
MTCPDCPRNARWCPHDYAEDEPAPEPALPPLRVTYAQKVANMPLARLDIEIAFAETNDPYSLPMLHAERDRRMAA